MKRAMLGFIVLILAVLCQDVLADDRFRFEIWVDLDARTLSLFDGDEEVAVYPVAVPRVIFFPLPLVGVVVGAEKYPAWRPTVKTRRDYYRKYGKELPKYIPPRSPLNAMGAGKLIIDFGGRIKDPIRIHGTNNEQSIGKKETRGCIRNRNKNILLLIDGIEYGRTKVTFAKGGRK